MRAMTRDRYGSADVLALDDIAMPVAGDDEVPIRVRAAGVGPDVWHLMTGLPYLVRLMGFGLRRPKNRVVGWDVAGIVEAVGKDVSQLGARMRCSAPAGAPSPSTRAAKPTPLRPSPQTSASNRRPDFPSPDAPPCAACVTRERSERGTRGCGGPEASIANSERPSRRRSWVSGCSLASAERRQDLLFLKDVIEGDKVTPVISRTFPLAEAAKALGDADEGHGRGKPVITD